MSFDDMPHRGQLLLPGGAEYATEVIKRSKRAVESTRNVIDVPYGQDYWQKIDIFLPARESASKVPVLAFTHGGAWRHGFKEWMGFMAPALVDIPAIFVSVGYRLAPENRHPDQLKDCCGAINWIYRNIGIYGGDPERIYVGGHSAGGHLAALLALNAATIRQEDVSGSVIKGCLPVSAPLSLHLEEASERRSYAIRLFLADEEDAHDASPVDHTNGNTVPFFLCWGSDDLPEVISSNKRMLHQLRRERAPVEFYVFQGKQHFDTSLDCVESNSVWAQVVRKWLETGELPPVGQESTGR